MTPDTELKRRTMVNEEYILLLVNFTFTNKNSNVFFSSLYAVKNSNTFPFFPVA